MQFPVRCCYAMTINKSQGQTLKHAGLDLRGDVFCHGQLYVAVSRTASRNNIICLVRPERLLDGIPHVHNVVYPELVQAATGHPPSLVITGEKPTDKTQIRAITTNKVRAMTPTARKATATTKMTTFTTTTTHHNGTSYLKLATVRVHYDAFQEKYTTRPICMSS